MSLGKSILSKLSYNCLNPIFQMPNEFENWQNGLLYNNHWFFLISIYHQEYQVCMYQVWMENCEAACDIKIATKVAALSLEIQHYVRFARKRSPNRDRKRA